MEWWTLPGGNAGSPDAEFIGSVSECPFCGHEGGFSVVFQVVRPKAFAFDDGLLSAVLKCSTCAHHLFLMGRTSRGGVVTGYQIEPQPKPDATKIKAPKEWPPLVGDAWAQAERSALSHSWDAAVAMARRSIQATLRQQGAQGKDLYKEINDLVAKGLLTRQMGDWAQEIRSLGNVGAHPHEDDKPVSMEDAKQAASFAKTLAHYVYTLPKEIEELRARREKDPAVK